MKINFELTPEQADIVIEALKDCADASAERSENGKAENDDQHAAYYGEKSADCRFLADTLNALILKFVQRKAMKTMIEGAARNFRASAYENGQDEPPIEDVREFAFSSVRWSKYAAAGLSNNAERKAFVKECVR